MLGCVIGSRYAAGGIGIANAIVFGQQVEQGPHRNFRASTQDPPLSAFDGTVEE